MRINLRKYSALITGMLLLTFSCSTLNSNIAKVYRNRSVDRDGMFTFKSKDKLTLYSDSTYFQWHKHSDGECGLSMNEKGRYKITGDTLILIPEVETMNLATKYIMHNNHLYYLDYKDKDGSAEPAFK
ncbi:MAG: hypothetical protein ABJH05_10150 [Fulvivirga sp.]